MSSGAHENVPTRLRPAYFTRSFPPPSPCHFSKMRTAEEKLVVQGRLQFGEAAAQVQFRLPLEPGHLLLAVEREAKALQGGEQPGHQGQAGQEQGSALLHRGENSVLRQAARCVNRCGWENSLPQGGGLGQKGKTRLVGGPAGRKERTGSKQAYWEDCRRNRRKATPAAPSNVTPIMAHWPGSGTAVISP